MNEINECQKAIRQFSCALISTGTNHNSIQQISTRAGAPEGCV
jgi:hypothetical protein